MVLKSLKDLLSKINFQRDVSRLWVVVVLIATVVPFSVLIYQKWPAAQLPETPPKPSVKKCATGALLAEGLQTYTILTDNPKNPQILQVDLDPLDVKIGEKQVLTVKVEDKKSDSVTSENGVTATYYTDAENAPVEIALELKHVDGPPLTTTWEGIWIPEYTHECVYMVTVKATGPTDESSVDLSFR